MERHAETTWLGVALAAVSLLCAYLAVVVLLGLLANNLFGIWWLDPAVGLLSRGWRSTKGGRHGEERPAPAANRAEVHGLQESPPGVNTTGGVSPTSPSPPTTQGMHSMIIRATKPTAMRSGIAAAAPSDLPTPQHD